MRKTIFLMMGLVCSFVVIGWAGDEVAAGKPMPVYILAGQSNMAGVKAITNKEKLPAELQKTNEDLLFVEFWNSEFKPLDFKTRIGPELGFGTAMVEATGGKIGIIKLATGGTSIKQHWNPDPDAYNKEKGVGVLYQRLLKYVKGVKAKNPNIEIVGMVWMQGEADSRFHAKTIDDYKVRLENLIKGYREAWDLPDMPFVCGRVNPPNWKYQTQVRTAQETISLKNYAWIDCDGFELGGDKLHFTIDGQVAMGKSFAQAMLKLIDVSESQKNTKK